MSTDALNFGNLFKQAEKEMTVIPEGDYDVICTQAEATKASTGSPMIKYRLKIQGGPQDGRVLYGNFTLTTDNPSALAIFFRNMLAFGLAASFWESNPQLPFVAESLVNRRCRATVKHDTWQDVLRAQVRAVKPIPGAPQAAPVVPAGPSAPGATAGPSAGPVPPSSSGPKAPSF